MNTGYFYRPNIALKTTFNEEAESYNKFRPGYHPELFDKLLEVVKLDENSNLLEIGTGTAQATKPLAEKGFKITGTIGNSKSSHLG